MTWPPMELRTVLNKARLLCWHGEPTYRLFGRQSIECLLCGSNSTNPHHVANLMCGCCRVFHEELWRMVLADERNRPIVGHPRKEKVPTPADVPEERRL